ncbi:MAG: hypothetical protein ACRBB3_02115 [Alphaproteobacteria bacterium]
MAYSSGSVESISEDIQKLLSDQREGVSGSYPADFLYHPLTSEDGTPLVVKVEDDVYSAWMSRDEAGEAFSNVTLLTIDQVNEVYKQIPGGPSGNMNEGPSVFVNPDLDMNDPKREIPADSVTRVSYSIETGEIQTAEQVVEEAARHSIDSRDARRAAAQARANGEDVAATDSAKFNQAVLPNSLIKDGHVSDDDLKQQLSGYQFISNVASEADEEKNKIAATSVIVNAVGKSVSRVNVTEGGAVKPDIEINDASSLSDANLSVETRLVSPYSQAAKPAEVKKTDVPDDSGFKSKMQGLIDAGPGSPKANNPFEASKEQILSRGFDDIAKNLAKGTLAGDTKAMNGVDSINVLFPEHSDVIAAYALAEEANPATDPKMYLNKIVGVSADVGNSSPTKQSETSAQASNTLQSMLDSVGDSVANGERVAQVNRDVEQVLRYLRRVSRVADTLQSEGGAAVNYLNNQGMGEHAKIISDYVQDPSTYKQARSDLREVSVVSAPALTAEQVADNKAWEDMAKNGSPDVSVTADEFAGGISAALSKLSDPVFVGNAIDKALADNPALADMVSKMPGGDIKSEVMEKLAGNNSPISSGNQADLEKEIASRVENAVKEVVGKNDVGNNAATVTPLDMLLDKLGKDVDDNASSSRINRDVGQVLRYLRSVSPNKELLESESSRAVDFLNDKGLKEHADIISDFAKDPSTFKDARSAIRELASVSDNVSAFGALASNVVDINAQIDEFKADLGEPADTDLGMDGMSLDSKVIGMKA